jgi:hypothetical protein
MLMRSEIRHKHAQRKKVEDGGHVNGSGGDGDGDGVVSLGDEKADDDFDPYGDE